MLNSMNKIFKYPRDMKTNICAHEINMLEIYRTIIQNKYQETFNCLGYSLKIGLEWNNGNLSNLGMRLSLKTGYMCSVFCEVQENNELVWLKQINQEVKYKPLFASWIIDYIKCPWNKPAYYLYNSTDDIFEDMDELIESIILAKDFFTSENALNEKSIKLKY